MLEFKDETSVMKCLQKGMKEICMLQSHWFYITVRREGLFCFYGLERTKVTEPTYFLQLVMVSYQLHCQTKKGSFKLNSYTNAKYFFVASSHAYFHFWGHELLTDGLISKHYPKSDAAIWFEKSSNSRAENICDTRFCYLTKIVLHEHFIAEQWLGVWMENAAAHP